MPAAAAARARWLSLSLFAATLSAGALAYEFAVGPLVPVSASDPFATCTEDKGQVGVNFPDTAVEPWLAVNPLQPDHLVGVWQQDRWSNGGSRGLVAGTSSDGGLTWRTAVVPGLTICSGGTFQRASDPWLSFSPDGTAHLVSLSFNSNAAGLGANSLLVTNSSDGGLSWSPPVPVIQDSDPTVLNDKESITADPNDPHLVYVTWDRLSSAAALREPLAAGERAAPIRFHSENVAPPRFAAAAAFHGPSYFNRSTDGGHSWETARAIYDAGDGNQTIGNQIVAQPDGTLIDGFNEIRNYPTRTIYRAAFVRSTDRGVTWEWTRGRVRLLPRALFSRSGDSVYDPGTGQGVRSGDIIPEIAVDANNGALYLVWQDARFSSESGLNDAAQLVDEIAFSMSVNGGRSWSRPVKINQTPSTLPLGNRQAFTPQVRVLTDGTVAVSYYDFRFYDPFGGTLNTDAFVVHCHPSVTAPCRRASSWGDEVRLTDASFDLRAAPVADGLFVGDYEGLLATGNDVLAFFAQAQGPHATGIPFRRLSAP